MDNTPTPESLSDSRFRLSKKEGITLAIGSAIALWSLKVDDPWVVVPMLTVSALAFVLLCVWHEGGVIWRAMIACVLVGVLCFIGWRELRHPAVVTAPAPLSPSAPVITQTDKGGKCTNVVAGRDANVDCSEKDNGKPQR